MFAKLSLLALAPLVAGLQINIPQNPTSGGQVTLTWTSQAGDPATFSIELINTIFNNAFAIANNVIPEQGEITITLPIVPVGAGYTIEAVNIGNINDVYAQTGSFSIGPNAASSSSSSSSSSGSSASGRPTSSGTTLSVPPTPPASTSFGVTVTPASSSSSSTSPGSSGTSASGAAPSTFPNGAAPAKNNAVGVAAVLLSAVAGAMIAL